MENTTGKILAELRKRKGFSQDSLANVSGIGKRTIQSIEMGEKKPQPITLSTLEKTLGVPTGTLSSNSFKESTVYFEEAKEDAITWFIKNLDNDSPNTRALSLCISEHIDKKHSLIRGILEHFGYTTTYIPLFSYNSEEYNKCINLMEEYDKKAIFPSFFKNWDIMFDKDVDFEKLLKEESETYINENLNYPLLIHRIEELGDTLLGNPSLTRNLPVAVRISKGDKVICQIKLHKFLFLTTRIIEAIDNTILSSTDLVELHPEVGTLIPNLPEDLKRNLAMNKRKDKINSPLEEN